MLSLSQLPILNDYFLLLTLELTLHFCPSGLMRCQHLLNIDIRYPKLFLTPLESQEIDPLRPLLGYQQFNRVFIGSSPR